MAIKIIVDSASDIDSLEAKQKGIILIPIEIMFGNDIYLDGKDLTTQRFYEKLIESDQLPKTSQINEYRFSEVFKEVIDSGDEAIVITLSSKLSGTYLNAKRAAEEFKNKIYVVDSLNASVGERLLVLYALELIKENKTITEIVSKLNTAKQKINLIAMLDTLMYLKKGGRISPLVAFSGELLHIKPVIGVINGEVKLLGKARGSKNGNNLLNKLIIKQGAIDFDMPLAAIYSGFNDVTLQKYIKDSIALYEGKIDRIPVYSIGCTIGTHIGPGAIGVAFFSK